MNNDVERVAFLTALGAIPADSTEVVIGEETRELDIWYIPPQHEADLWVQLQLSGDGNVYTPIAAAVHRHKAIGAARLQIMRHHTPTSEERRAMATWGVQLHFRLGPTQTHLLAFELLDLDLPLLVAAVQAAYRHPWWDPNDWSAAYARLTAQAEPMVAEVLVVDIKGKKSED